MIWKHLSELAIDKLLAGELAAVDATAMRDHAKDCAPCSDRLADAVDVQRQFAFDRPPLPITVPLRPALAIRGPLSTRSRARIYVAASALAAAVAVVLLWPRTGSSREVVATREHGNATRTKGDAIAGFYVAHGDAVRRGGLRETVAPGDRIELFTSTTSRAWFAATSVDGAGHRTVYIEPRQIEPGHETVVPLSIELDDTLGEETVTTMFCPEQVGRFDPEHVPAACTVSHFTLVKVLQ